MTLSASQIMPLKSVKPFVVQVDEKSGVVQVVDSKSLKEYSANEALIRYFAIAYIQAREGYNFHTFQQDRRTVSVMSDRDIMRTYNSYISPDNLNSPLNVFGTSTERKIFPKGFTFLSKNSTTGESMVQAVLVVQEISTNRLPQQYTMTVTLTCIFDPAFSPNDEDRISNPLGFKVVAYRSDKDIATLAPAR